ncbi:hypothetical protein D3C72_182810 [compost metagenome]
MRIRSFVPPRSPRTPLLLVFSFLVGCGALRHQQAPPQAEMPPSQQVSPSPQVPVTIERPLLPLPGGLDGTPVLNSNSPGIIQQEGILVSTLPPRAEADGKAFLDYAFEGKFSYFSHHIAKDETPGERLLYVGLVATSLSDQPRTIRPTRGASYLSQPDAPFSPLDPIVPNPQGAVYAGPGDRVATELLLGKSNLPLDPFRLEPRESKLLYQWPIPTDVTTLPPVNGRTVLADFESDGPVYLSEVAIFAKRSETGEFLVPQLDDYQALIRQGRLAGDREAAATPFDPGQPPPKGGFTFGRVAGVSLGSHWLGDALSTEEESASLSLPGSGVGYPLATTYLNRLGTGQVQSAPMLRRYPKTAYQAHGNYGVTYRLRLPLSNPEVLPRRYALSLSHPVSATGRTVTYLEPPKPPVTFRGTVRLDWKDERGMDVTRLTHVTLQQGQRLPPFEVIEVPPQSRREVLLQLIYPADATPPQLLTIARE